MQMVLDAGRIVGLCRGYLLFLTTDVCIQVEFDKPYVLLQREGGYLRRLVDESGTKEREELWKTSMNDCN